MINQTVVIAQVQAHPATGQVQLVIDPNHPNKLAVALAVAKLGITYLEQAQRAEAEGAVPLHVPGRGVVMLGGNGREGG